MTAGQADPSQVRLGGRLIVVTTDCCHAQMGLPRDHTDLVLAHQLVCPGCGRRRQLDFAADARLGLRATWSDPRSRKA